MRGRFICSNRTVALAVPVKCIDRQGFLKIKQPDYQYQIVCYGLPKVFLGNDGVNFVWINRLVIKMEQTVFTTVIGPDSYQFS